MSRSRRISHGGRGSRWAAQVAACTTLAAAGALAAPSAAHAASAATPYVPTRVDAPQGGTRWAERIVSAAMPGPLGGNPVVSGDIDGDGVNDYWIAQPFDAASPSGSNSPGRVYLVSGRTAQTIYRINTPVATPPNTFNFGFYISSPGDITGDGKSDIVVGTDSQNVTVNAGLGGCTSPATAEPNGCNEGQGMAWAFNGATGALLYTFNNPSTQGGPGSNARFGSRIGRAGDVNADGVADIIIGASNQDVCDNGTCTAAVAAAAATPGTQANAGDLACGDVSPIPNGCGKNQGQAFIFSGSSGLLLRTLDLPVADQVPTASTSCTANCGGYGLAVQSPGDVNGDGVADQQVDGSNLTVGGHTGQGRVYLYSGSTGALLATIDDPVPQNGATFGFQDAAPNSPGDINSDGVPDIYANGFGQDGPLGAGQGRAWIFDGKTTVQTGIGQLLVTVDDPSPELGGQFGWSMATTDFNKDGKADFYVGQSPHHVPNATGSGGTYVFDGPLSAAAGPGGTAVVVKSLELPPSDVQFSTSTNLGPNLGWGLAAPGDLDGDGEPDYLAGAPFRDVAGGLNSGQMFAFMSRERPPAAAVDGSATTDLTLYRTGAWYALDQRTGGTVAQSWGADPSDKPLDGDFDGDGRHDLATWRESTGLWAIHNSSGAPDTFVTYGGPNDVPAPADYDGDGKADLGIYRPELGTWYLHLSGGGDVSLTFGIPGDIPVPGDYDGDGKADIALFRVTDGTWFVHGSAVGDYALAWGTAGDIPIPGDYDGDHKTDIAIFRPSTGLWAGHASGGGDAFATYGGIAGDIPVPGDYDGDGSSDLAIFRPSVGGWYVHRSTDGADTATTWGTSGDRPLALPSAIRDRFF